MSQLTITDEAVLSQLDSGTGSIAVRDGDGKLRGYFIPVRLSDLQPQISEEELLRREQDTTSPRYTTEEVIAKLRSL
jgi:hypothetical protein